MLRMLQGNEFHIKAPNYMKDLRKTSGFGKVKSF